MAGRQLPTVGCPRAAGPTHRLGVCEPPPLESPPAARVRTARAAGASRHRARYFGMAISIFFASAALAFGILIVTIPSLNSALIASASIDGGSRNARSKTP